MREELYTTTLEVPEQRGSFGSAVDKSRYRWSVLAWAQCMVTSGK
jgi:hypothetical protein